MPFLVAGATMLRAALARRVSVPGVFASAPAGLGRAALRGTIFGAFGLLALAAPAAADDQTTCRAGGDDGIAACSRLIGANPSNASAFVSRGSAYNNKGDYDRAITDMNDAIQLDAENAVAFSNRGRAYAGKGENDRAIADFDEAIRLDPKLTAAAEAKATVVAKVAAAQKAAAPAVFDGSLYGRSDLPIKESPGTR